MATSHLMTVAKSAKTPLIFPAAQILDFSTAVVEAENRASDISWTGRVILYDSQCITGHASLIGEIGNQTLGEPSLTNMVRGPLVVAKALKDRAAAIEIGDTTGERLSLLDIAIGSTQTAVGVDFVGLRSTTVASALKPHNTHLLNASKFFGLVLSVLLAPLYALLGVAGAILSSEASNFYKGYLASGKSFTYLVDNIFVTPGEIDSLVEKNNTGLLITGREALEKEFDPKSEHGTVRGFELDYAYLLSPEQRDSAIDGLLRKLFPDQPELLDLKKHYFAQAKSLPTDLCAVIGLVIRLKAKQAANEATVARALGGESLQKIKSAALSGLEARLTTAPAALKEKEVLDKTLDAAYTKNQRFYRALILLGVIGVGVTIAGFLLTGPVGLAVLFGISLLWTGLSVLVDNYCLKLALDGPPGRYDKALVALFATLVVVGIALTVATFVVTGGAAPLIFGLYMALGGLLLGSYARAYRKLSAQQRKFKEDHPTLEDLTHALAGKTGQVEPKTLALFKKLPKLVHRKITDKLATAAPQSEHLLTYLYSSEYAENEQLLRAIRKTAQSYWKEWWHSGKKDVQLQQKAIKIEKIVQGLKDENLLAARAAYHQLSSDERRRLHANITRVVKREESAEHMSAVISRLRVKTA